MIRNPQLATDAEKLPFSWPVRVYYEDTDTGGIVFYANYLKFFERARTEWLRSGGIDQSRLAAAHGIMFVVMRTAVDYHAPAKLDNELKMSVVVERLGRASVDFLQHAWRIGGTENSTTEDQTQPGDTSVGAKTAAPLLIATGHIKVACVDQHSLRPRPIPQEVIQFMQGCA